MRKYFTKILDQNLEIANQDLETMDTPLLLSAAVGAVVLFFVGICTLSCLWMLWVYIECMFDCARELPRFLQYVWHGCPRRETFDPDLESGASLSLSPNPVLAEPLGASSPHGSSSSSSRYSRPLRLRDSYPSRTSSLFSRCSGGGRGTSTSMSPTHRPHRTRSHTWRHNRRRFLHDYHRCRRHHYWSTHHYYDGDSISPNGSHHILPVPLRSHSLYADARLYTLRGFDPEGPNHGLPCYDEFLAADTTSLPDYDAIQPPPSYDQAVAMSTVIATSTAVSSVDSEKNKI